MEKDLPAFLRDRGVGEEVISKLQNDKIDSSIIQLMSDADLAKYLPHYGDRLAVSAFCRPNNQGSSRDNLLAKIKSKVSGKLEKPSERAEAGPSTKAGSSRGTENTQKKGRRVEIGWMNYCEKEKKFKQVRAPKGGGTRHLTVEKNTKISAIKEMAQDLFFPNGRCRSCNLKDYDAVISDFSENKIDVDSTIEETYERYKVKMLRLYLYTTFNSVTPTDVVVIDEETDGGDLELHLSDDSEPGIEQTTVLSSTPIMDVEMLDFNMGSNAESVTEKNDVSLNNSTDSEVIVGASSHNTSINLDDTLPLNEPKTKVVLVISRSNCMSELINAFTDTSIIHKDVHIRRRLPNGQIEEGEGPGVFRDCLSEFWSEFYSRCTLGQNVKVPYIRHEYQEQEWQAIARIVVAGWNNVQYFPVSLALPFLEEAFYGTYHSCLIESFLQYVSKEEQEILSVALKSYNSVKSEELIDVLDAYDCHIRPSKGRIQEIVSQLAHKTLIQTPKYVIDCWKPVLHTLKDALNPKKLVEIIQERVPTPRRVKELIQFPENMTSIQNNVARHLKKYIGECDKNMLKCFLRFCTGADMLFDQRITVNFTETSNFQCRPQAHTCGAILVLPINYQNYPDLRNDFDMLLKSSVWVMDII